MTSNQQSGRDVLETDLAASAPTALTATLAGDIERSAAPFVDVASTRATTAIDQALAAAAINRDVPGVVAAAAGDAGLFYEGAFGKRDLSKNESMTPDTVFWIASMTKAVTATAAMQLVEQGKLELEQPVAEVIPALASPQVLEGFDASGMPRLRPAKRPITLRHLLTHTAGFSYDIWNADIGRYMKYADLPGIITCKNDALRTPLVFDPGERWEYGINMDWVGKAVEAISGQPLDAYFREHIFTPLGMADTGFAISPSQRPRLASMHQRNPDGSLEPMAFEMTQEPEFFMGGGGLYGTARDFLAFLQMLMHGGQWNGAQLLRPDTVARMAENHIGDLNVRAIKAAMPDLSNDVDFFPGMDLKWGLSFLINTEPVPGARSTGSLTWAGLGNTYFWLDPAKKVAGVILTQILPFADDKAVKLYDEFERRVYQATI